MRGDQNLPDKGASYLGRPNVHKFNEALELDPYPKGA